VVIVDARGTPGQTHQKIIEVLSSKLALVSSSKRMHHAR